MNSMTAFGRGEATNGTVTVVVELKSVNSRFRDLNLRVPREYQAVEPRITAVLREAFDRGRIDCTVRAVGHEGPNTVTPDLRLAEACFRAMRDVARHLQVDEGQVRLDLVLAQPGVLVFSEEDLDVGRAWELLEPALVAAVAHLAEMRAREGQALKRDLQQHLGELARLLDSLAELSAGVVARLQRRLEDRLQVLVKDLVDPARLAQEAAILADKADISEEIARLGSHLDQFRLLLAAREAVGRRMEFLLQEMHREVNTIGSKAVGEEPSRIVVEMKAVLERLREQAANVE